VDAINGDDANGDGSEGNPYASIINAQTNISPGNAIFLLSDILTTNTLVIEKDLDILSHEKSFVNTTADELIQLEDGVTINIYGTKLKGNNHTIFMHYTEDFTIKLFNCVLEKKRQ
jgi:hypothetical protein